jgi:tetratricopeptide (TPR) repeat protein
LLREAHAIDLEVFGADHAETAPAAGLLGDVLLAKGDATAAETMLADALRICRLRLRADHPRLAAAQSHLADALVKNGDYNEAETLYNDALTIQRKKLRSGDGEIAHTLLGLADVAQHHNDFAAARRFVDEASPILANSVADVEALRRRLTALRTSLPTAAGKRDSKSAAVNPSST